MQHVALRTSPRQQLGQGHREESPLLGSNPGGEPTPRSTFPGNEEFKGERISRNNEFSRVSDSALNDISGYSEVLNGTDTGIRLLEAENTDGSNWANVDGIRTHGPYPQIGPPMSSSETSSQVRIFTTVRDHGLGGQGARDTVLGQMWSNGRELIEGIAEDPTPLIDHLGPIQFMGLTPGQSLFLTTFAMVGMGSVIAIWHSRRLLRGTNSPLNYFYPARTWSPFPGYGILAYLRNFLRASCRTLFNLFGSYPLAL